VDQEASNFAKVGTYREKDEAFSSRYFRSIPPAFRRIVRVRVYPNLVLLTLSATDVRIMGPASDFQKTLKALALLDLVDRENLNLIVVVTSALLIPHRVYANKSQELSCQIKDCVFNILRVSGVPVIFVENMAEDHYALKPEGSDFYELPDGEC